MDIPSDNKKKFSNPFSLKIFAVSSPFFSSLLYITIILPSLFFYGIIRINELNIRVHFWKILLAPKFRDRQI